MLAILVTCPTVVKSLCFSPTLLHTLCTVPGHSPWLLVSDEELSLLVHGCSMTVPRWAAQEPHILPVSLGICSLSLRAAAAVADGCRAGHVWLVNEEERGQNGARSPPALPFGPWRVWGLKRRLEDCVLYRKMLGTLHLSCRPENTQRDSVYKIPGLCFLIPVYKITGQLDEIMVRLCGAICHGLSWR